MYFLLNFILPFCGYVVGSISSAIIVSRLMRLPDPRSSGSNNPGATNVLRLGGKKAAIITLLGDLFKGLIPILLTKIITDNNLTIALVGLGSFLGHLYPIFFNFKGGKGIATAAGVFIGLSGSLSLTLFGIWVVVALLSRYSSLAALVATALSPLLVLLFVPNLPIFILACTIAVLIFWRHRENLTRLRNGTEGKINFKKNNY